MNLVFRSTILFAQFILLRFYFLFYFRLHIIILSTIMFFYFGIVTCYLSQGSWGPTTFICIIPAHTIYTFHFDSVYYSTLHFLIFFHFKAYYFKCQYFLVHFTMIYYYLHYLSFVSTIFQPILTAFMGLQYTYDPVQYAFYFSRLLSLILLRIFGQAILGQC